MKSEASARNLFDGANSACVLDDATLSIVLNAGKKIQLEIGDTLPNDQGDKLYVLLGGGIRLLKTTKNGEQFTTMLLDEKGQVFGSKIIVQESSEPEIARATDTTLVLQLDKAVIQKLCESNVLFRERLLRWELIRHALSKLKDLPEWARAKAKSIQNLLGGGNLVQLSAGQSIDLSIPHVHSGILLCSGKCDLSVKGNITSLKEGTAVEVFESQASTISLTANSSSTIFIGQYSNISNVLAETSAKDTDLEAIQIEPEIIDKQTTSLASGAAEVKETTGSPITWVRKQFHQYPLLVQMNAMDCGVACLAMVTSYFGSSVSINRLRELAKVTNQGTDLKSLSDAAETVGFLARGVKANYEGLLQLNLPLICHWGSNHYVVLYEIDAKGVTIADPADDLVTLPRSKFLERYSGYALELTASKSHRHPLEV